MTRKKKRRKQKMQVMDKWFTSSEREERERERARVDLCQGNCKLWLQLEGDGNTKAKKKVLDDNCIS